MRYLAVFFFALFNFSIYAQSGTFLQVQGGHIIVTDYGNKYSGFEIVNLSFIKVKEKRKSSYELELVGFSLQNERQLSNGFIIEANTRFSKSAEFIYGHTYYISDNSPNGVFIGPSASILYASNIFEPETSASFPREDLNISLGLGAKAGFDYAIAEAISISLSTRVTLLDFGIDRQYVDNPSLPENLRTNSGFDFNLLRKRISILLGVRFQI